MHASAPVDICWVINNFIGEMQKVLGQGNIVALREGVRATLMGAIQRYVEEVGNVGDIRAIQLPQQPSVAQMLARKWSKGGNFANFHPKATLSLEVLLVRLGSLAYFQTEISAALTRLYEQDSPQLIHPLHSLLTATIDTLCDYTACTVINVDLFSSLFQGLYRDSDLSLRIQTMVTPFKLMLTKCPKDIFPSLLSKALDCFVAAWSRVLLETDPTIKGLRETLATDLTSIQHFFEAKQRSGTILGLEKALQAPYLTPVAEVMSLALKGEEALKELFADAEVTKQRRMWICYLFYYRQSKAGLEFISQNKHLVL